MINVGQIPMQQRTKKWIGEAVIALVVLAATVFFLSAISSIADGAENDDKPAATESTGDDTTGDLTEETDDKSTDAKEPKQAPALNKVVQLLSLVRDEEISDEIAQEYVDAMYEAIGGDEGVKTEDGKPLDDDQKAVLFVGLVSRFIHTQIETAKASAATRKFREKVGLPEPQPQQ